MNERVWGVHPCAGACAPRPAGGPRKWIVRWRILPHPLPCPLVLD